MKLANAAKYFDRVSMADAYTGTTMPYKVQFSTFEETDPDGSVARRRTLSMAPGLTLPARRVASLLGEIWLLGEPSADAVFDKVIRQTVPMRRVTNLAQALTPGQMVAASTGLAIYGRLEQVKSTVDTATSSDYFPFFTLTLAGAEFKNLNSDWAQVPGFFRIEDGTLFRCRTSYPAEDGMTVVEADLIDRYGLTQAQVTTGAYDPVTDTFAGTTSTFQTLVMPTHQLYRRKVEAEKFKPEDLTVLVRFADYLAPKVGTPLQIRIPEFNSAAPAPNAPFSPVQIVGITLEADCWNLHV
ncbi:MAG: hypothetical protein ACRCTO_19260, partial [Pseudomonas paracarnis]